jgi:hypothetical protein
MIPVRMEDDTVLGGVVSYLAELTVQGIHLHLTGERGLSASAAAVEPG